MRMIRSEVQAAFIDSFVDHPGLTEQLAEVQGIRLDSWSPPSIREALSIPAVLRAVTLIANTTGMLLMQAFRDSQLLPNQPTLVTRPGIDGTPRDFWRDSAWGLATRGEFIWRTVDRDDEGRARKLLLLPPAEVTVSWNERVPFLRDYKWRNLSLDRQDVTHGFFARDPWGLRGFGPLQLCGAALSAAVEAHEWAANFFAEGGVPSVAVVSENKITPDEAELVRKQWLEKRGNSVRVIDRTHAIEPIQVNPEQAQLIQSRNASAGDVATMFGINGHLLNYAQAGTTLTYQNVGDVFADFVRSTLAPGYLVPIEDAITDLLSRSTTARFNTQELYRADIKTRADVFAVLSGAGMEDAEVREVAGFDQSAELAAIPDQSPVRIEVPNA